MFIGLMGLIGLVEYFGLVGLIGFIRVYGACRLN